ncbi:hypothetical protein RMQ97_02260 [Maricaulis sp. D1M11]|uniref:hypothetical protein n=1 Tax=Maricaulis sp. D1M11 TaxID=3076117 RepID=UPI0039B58DFB
MKALASLALTATLALALPTLAAPALAQDDHVAPEPVASQVSLEDGLSAWNQIHEVFSHPRCANCHVGEDNIPRWSGPHYGDEPRNHGMFVNGDDSRFGVESITCTTCHATENAQVLHGPPGAEVWMLAPVEFVWWEKTSQEICEQVKDPERNGFRSIEDLAHHVEFDALVLWGWNPGPGREPAPYSASELASFVRTWGAAGAPCPAG